MSDSNNEYQHKAEWPDMSNLNDRFGESIIERHYGLVDADTVVESIKKLGEAGFEIKKPFDKNSILIHRGNVIPFGLPHIDGVNYNASQRAERVHRSVMLINMKKNSPKRIFTNRYWLRFWLKIFGPAINAERVFERLNKVIHQ